MSCNDPSCACHTMTEEEQRAAYEDYMAKVREATTLKEPGLWWLSFADETGFKGLIILETPAGGNPQDSLAALEAAKAFTLDGEVQAMRIPDNLAAYPAEYRNRPLTREEAMQLGGQSTLAQEAQFEKNVTNPTIQ